MLTYQQFALIVANKNLRAGWDALMADLGHAVPLSLDPSLDGDGKPIREPK